MVILNVDVAAVSIDAHSKFFSQKVVFFPVLFLLIFLTHMISCNNLYFPFLVMCPKYSSSPHLMCYAASLVTLFSKEIHSIQR